MRYGFWWVQQDLVRIIYAESSVACNLKAGPINGPA